MTADRRDFPQPLPDDIEDPIARGYFFYDHVTTRIAETSDRPFVVDVARDHTVTDIRILQAGS